MEDKPPDELFLLMWEDPWQVIVSNKIDDWGENSEPPKFWVRYRLSDWGTIEDRREPPEPSMGSEE